MICALIGDQTIRNLNEERLELRLRTLIEQEHVSAFVLGYFGPFERLAFRVIRRLQQDYPLLDYTVILYQPVGASGKHGSEGALLFPKKLDGDRQKSWRYQKNCL